MSKILAWLSVGVSVELVLALSQPLRVVCLVGSGSAAAISSDSSVNSMATSGSAAAPSSLCGCKATFSRSPVSPLVFLHFAAEDFAWQGFAQRKVKANGVVFGAALRGVLWSKLSRPRFCSCCSDRPRCDRRCCCHEVALARLRGVVA